MDMPPPCMVDHPGPNLYQPLDYRVYGRLDALAPECRIPNHVQQIVGKASDEKPCLIGCESVATRFVPSKGILSLFYPIFDLSPSIVDRNYLFCCYAGVSHNKSDTGEKFTHVPFDFTDNPSRFILFLRLVMKLNPPYLNAPL